MNHKINTIVAILKYKADWAILHQQLWYRIPVSKNAPLIVRNNTIQYIAFYHPQIFGEDLQYKIIKYARVTQITTVTRSELFPKEPDNQKTYYKIQFDELLTLPSPIVARKGRRINFINTTDEKLLSGNTNFNHLICGSPLEEDMKSIMETMKIEYEREWEQSSYNNKIYRLDFAIFCKDRNIDIECDGNEFHMGNENVHYDKTRNNELESFGWKVLRYTTKHFKEEREHIQKTIYKTIIDCGGIQKIAEPEATYIPDLPKPQLRLFEEPKPEYKKS
jgi:REase_MTES_1575